MSRPISAHRKPVILGKKFGIRFAEGILFNIKMIDDYFYKNIKNKALCK